MLSIVIRKLTALVLAVSLPMLLAGAVAAQEPSPVPSAGPSPSPSMPPPALEPEGSWEVRAFDAWAEGLVEPLPGTTLALSLLADGRLEGETGCGPILGGYVLDGDRIELFYNRDGAVSCSPERREETAAFSVAVDAVSGWRSTAAGLELLDESDTVRVVLDPVIDPGLTGQWVAERYTRANGKTAEPLTDRPITITFGDDGGVLGSTGCRWIEGRFSRDGDRVLIAPIEAVGLTCEGEPRRQERRVLRILDEVVRWERADGRLVLADGSGMPLLELREVATE